jgi:seryl-tRNA synthetase
MHDLRLILEQPDQYRDMLRDRGDDPATVDRIVSEGDRRRALLQRIEELRAERNSCSKAIGQLFRDGKREEAEGLKGRVAEVGQELSQLEPELAALKERLQDELMGLPNLISDAVPRGLDETANRHERSWGDPPEFSFEARDHHALGEALGILDFERGAKLAGARFTVLRGAASRLNRALINFMLDLHTTEFGYTEVLPPFIASRETLTASGQLPKFEEDLFQLVDPESYYLIPTAEVQLVNLHRDEILDGDALPLKYCAYTPCFRAEAGSYGKDTRGLIRQHQFDKVELVMITRAEHSEDAHEEMVEHAEQVLQRLELPYRVMTLSSGDIGFAAWKCYDLEVWLPGQGCYREISSVSNVRDFQGRRAQVRYRPAPKAKPEIAHALNGSGLAVGRTLIAILENHQQADGSVAIPDALRPYCGGLEGIEAAALG